MAGSSFSSADSSVKRIAVIGGSFAGMTAAIELKNHLGDDADVTVFSAVTDFTFMPSLIWVPFGLRQREDITFPLGPVFSKKGVNFVHAQVTRLNLPEKQLEFREFDGLDHHTTVKYDYLVIATGPKMNYDAIKGFSRQDGFVQSIFSWDDADKARLAFAEFEKNPGPIVVGGVQGASCFGAAYEFLFNMAYQLKKRGLAEKCPLTYVTSEPFLAHFGIGGFGKGTQMTEWFFKDLKITGVTNASIKEFTKDDVVLDDDRRIPFAYAMFAPAFLGVDAVRACSDITTPSGFVKVKDTYQTEIYPEVYAAGVAVQLDPPEKTPVPCGVPKTGYLSEEMAKVVAHNIVADIRGTELQHRSAATIDAKCVLDAGNTGIIMTSDHFLEPRDHAWLIPGPEAHWAKLAFEKYFLATHRRGHV